MTVAVSLAGARRSALLLAPFALAACLGGPQPDPSAFFLLSPAPPPPAASTPVPVSVGLGPIALPGYLDRPQIVMRVDDNQVALAENDRWAEPLMGNLLRTLEDNLTGLLPGSVYVDYPWYASETPDFALEIDFRRFETDPAGAAVLEATWEIARDGVRVDGNAARIEEAAAPVPERGAAVAALSRALASLSQEIAAAVRRAAGR